MYPLNFFTGGVTFDQLSAVGVSVERSVYAQVRVSVRCFTVYFTDLFSLSLSFEFSKLSHSSLSFLIE
ncbi:hypothetical protein IJS64_02735 [bacterium]|nr:hypothetical protein [bacterium]